MRRAFAALLLPLLAIAPALGQEDELDTEGVDVPLFYEYDPPSTLVVPEHLVTRAKFPFVDAHNHQFEMPDQDLGELVQAMDAMNMAVMVNLSGRGFRRIENPDGTTSFDVQGPEYLARAVENARQHAPGRFIVFTNVSFAGIGEEGWTENAVRELEEDVAHGAGGLKIYKNLGLSVRDTDGKRVPVNDPRLDPIWEKAGELGIPVLIHTADPAPFWQAKDKNNERLFELMERPGRYQGPDAETTFEGLLAEQHDIFRRHPNTIFIDAHLGWLGNDLARLGALLDELPNVYTEIGAVLAELGRQPRFARKFFLEHGDRILFGKDSWHPEEYPVYFRVLETADDYFDYYRKRHAFWKIYGLDLPDDVLRKVYYENALRIYPTIDRSLFPSETP